ncbi:sigma-70 family RNA polymerase sigma factor [Mesobacillus stamsii]|uniref:RNA polymerase sigma factor (Sigma-70 family) n=1 Tax=Mesobacillus stamsii TaxID=225347 RepID=A0ABU0FXY3_9BACI|nr:sigma-70 family RNA polymerase sigma factor [Mesobacillus stamsii]MDQ0414203.1 RNA polymerase sigma factor (sigma-70 family) [Mesobacillus stamsii]
MPKVYSSDQLALSSEQRELAEKYAELTDKFISIFNRRFGGYGFDAVHDAGVEALIKSARNFSADYGVEFGQFLYYNMQKEMHKTVRFFSQQKRKGKIVSMDKENEQLNGNPGTLHDLISVEDKYQFFDTSLLNLLMSKLNRQERFFITLHYVHELSQREIATEVGMSQPHVGRILKKALGKMRDHANMVS